MLKLETKTFDGHEKRLAVVGESGERRIRTVAVLNNTPYYLYVGLEQRPTRETALVVVNPYTDVVTPVDVSQALYVLEGPAIGVIPANCQATILYGADTYQGYTRAAGRTVVIPLVEGKVGSSSTYLTAQALTSATEPTVFAIPASARRRTIYGYEPQVGKFTTARLDGSFNRQDWFPVAELPTGGRTFTYPLPDGLALPPYLQLSLDAGAQARPYAYMVVDL